MSTKRTSASRPAQRAGPTNVNISPVTINPFSSAAGHTETDLTTTRQRASPSIGIDNS